MSQTVLNSTAQSDLRDRGRILLLSCYELGHQPLNLAFPLATLRAEGYDPVARDTSVESLDDDEIMQAGFVAISVPMHTALRLGVQIADRIRARKPDTPICFYGLYAWMNADYLLDGRGDYVIGGEQERALLDLVRAIERGDGGLPDGVSNRDYRAAPAIERIAFATPVRDALPSPDKYARLLLNGQAIPAGYTETTRGCHHTCRHCPVVPIYGGRFFAVPRNVVLDDIRSQVQQGAGHITFGDPDFLNGPTHALRVCRAMHEEFPHVTFDMTTRIEHILENRDNFTEFKELGCVFVLTALESISELVLEKIDKGHTKADVIEALGILDAAGITMRPSLLPFTPWTTLDDYLELLTFFEEYELVSNVDPVHFSIRLLVPPGSALLDQPDSVEWVGELDAAAFTYTWKNPDPRVDDLQREIAAIVEAAESASCEPEETFAQIKAASWAMAGKTPPAIERKRTRPPGQPPRLTESWFC
ncbi:MAG: CUAEP/CCAEP-tail radical SAM protein [Thermomicrobiales bacterium]|nr:CUAEP/CCAEP-tail radical SAM protein [Thermomicrobiales bacterium]